MDIQIQFIAAFQTWALRNKVLRPHQTINECIFSQDEWPTTFHVGALLMNHVVCVATFHEEIFVDLKSEKPYRLRGMATDFDFRQMHLGRAVLEKSFEELRTRGSDLLWCNAREVAFPFYERLGLQFIGPLFEIPGLGPHKVMYKYLR